MLGDKRCQVEAWSDRSRESTQGWFVPACNFGANIEWQVGFGRAREEGASRFSESYAQGKTVFKAIEDDSPWGVGLVLGVIRRPRQAARRGWDNPYAIVPVSAARGEALVHVNVGWSRDAEASRDVTLWGLAFEAPPVGAVTPLAEAFGENRERPFLRAGVRISLLKEEMGVDLDLTVVARPGGTRDERFISLGVFWQSGRWLP